MQCVSYTVLPFPVAAAANGDVYTLGELIVPGLGISVSFQYNSINQLLKTSNDDHIADDHFLRQHPWITILFANKFAVQYFLIHIFS